MSRTTSDSVSRYGHDLHKLSIKWQVLDIPSAWHPYSMGRGLPSSQSALHCTRDSEKVLVNFERRRFDMIRISLKWNILICNLDEDWRLLKNNCVECSALGPICGTLHFVQAASSAQWFLHRLASGLSLKPRWCTTPKAKKLRFGDATKRQQKFSKFIRSHCKLDAILTDGFVQFPIRRQTFQVLIGNTVAPGAHATTLCPVFVLQIKCSWCRTSNSKFISNF